MRNYIFYLAVQLLKLVYIVFAFWLICYALKNSPHPVLSQPTPMVDVVRPTAITISAVRTNDLRGYSWIRPGSSNVVGWTLHVYDGYSHEGCTPPELSMAEFSPQLDSLENCSASYFPFGQGMWGVFSLKFTEYHVVGPPTCWTNYVTNNSISVVTLSNLPSSNVVIMKTWDMNGTNYNWRDIAPTSNSTYTVLLTNEQHTVWFRYRFAP